MSLGRVRAEQQLVFINTGLLVGLQSYSINQNLGNFSLKYIGIGNKPLNQTVNSIQSVDLSVSTFLLQDDVFIQQTGLFPINAFIMESQTNINSAYSLISGYLSNYSAKYVVNQIPQISSTFKFYNAGNINLGNLDNSVSSQLNNISGTLYPSFNNLIANSNYMNLVINEGGINRILDYTFSIDINRLPIYNVGSRFPIRTDIIFPVNVTCDITFEADLNFSDIILTDFPGNKVIQNLEIDVYSNQNNQLMFTYLFNNMTLVSNKRDINSDGNLTIVRKYIGQLFTFIEQIGILPLNTLDFGFVASGVNYYIDWGYVSQPASGFLDFGYT